MEVLEVYRITLLSNITASLIKCGSVLEVYRITLLSNTMKKTHHYTTVLEVYRITLLSNRKEARSGEFRGFRGL